MYFQLERPVVHVKNIIQNVYVFTAAGGARYQTD
jgi:hypothetical protein